MNRISPTGPHSRAAVAAAERSKIHGELLLELTGAGQADADESAVFQKFAAAAARLPGIRHAEIWRHFQKGMAVEKIAGAPGGPNISDRGTVMEGADAPVFESPESPVARAAGCLDIPIRGKNGLSGFLRIVAADARREWAEDETAFGRILGNLLESALQKLEQAETERTLAADGERFHAVAAVSNDTIWDWNLETDQFWWNDGFSRLFGWPMPSHEAGIQIWIRQIHPDDRERVLKGLYSAIEGGASEWTDSYRFVSNSEAVSHVRDHGRILRTPDGHAVRIVGGMTDITASVGAEASLERTNRALRMLSSCNEMLIRTSDEQQLLTEICRLAVETGGYRMAWVGYALDDERKSVKPMAWAGQELGYLSEIQVSWAEDHSTGIGPVGQAIRGRRPIVFEDVLETPSFSYWLSPARKRGYRSVVCLPVLSADRALGAICLYGAEANLATQDELELLGSMAGDLAFGIESIRSRKAQQRAQEIVIKVAQAVSSSAGSEFFDLLTRNMVEALGALGGMIGRYRPADNSMDTISFQFAGEMVAPLNYGLAGTPCEGVAKGDICVFERNVRNLFPRDHLLADHKIEAYVGIPLLEPEGGVLGIMAVLFAMPLPDPSLATSTLRIFATRAAAELNRLQSDARIREQASLLDKAKDAILVRGLDHRIEYWNKSAERLYGWSAEEALGKSAQALLYSDQAAYILAHEQVMRTGEWIGEMHQTHKSGRDLIIEGRWTLVRDANNEPESIFILNTDISEHRRLEQQFLRAQRMESIGTLAGGIAHDLNNILAPISMAIELLKMRVTDGRSTELLETIAISARRGAEMVGQVLSFARGMDGRRVEVLPRQIILEVEKIMRDTFLKKIEIRVRIGSKLRAIHGDPTQIHQVLLNLCVNARDAVAENGKITVTAENVDIDRAFAADHLEANEGPHVRIVVSDNGPGIPTHVLDRIFEPFFTTKSVGKGTGLGLSTTLAIVKGHGGFIRVNSEPGKGATFEVYLPAAADPEAPPAFPASAELPRGSGETILVIDDEAAIRTVTRQTLRSFGYQVLVASSGRSGVAVFRKHRHSIALVITDMMMPVMDGAATVKELMRIAPEIRIIATSGIGSKGEAAMRAGVGVKRFLPKPFTAETLLGTIHQVLSQPSGAA